MKQFFVAPSLFLSSLVIAADTPLLKATPDSANVLGFGELAELVTGLLLVVALIFLSGFVVRRLNKGGMHGSRDMQVLSTLSLGMKEKVLLVEVGKQQLLLGVTPSNVNTLHVFDHPVVDSGQADPPEDFSSKLREFVSQGKR
jgi:flagellar protein FliO/FliZ